MAIRKAAFLFSSRGIRFQMPFRFSGLTRVAYERNAYDIWWEIVVEKDKRFGGFAIYIPQARCYNTGVLKKGYYLRYYRYSEKGAKRAFNVLSLGYNRCMAKLDYTRFLCRHPSKHRFSESNGRTLNSYYGTRQKGQ